MIAAFPASPPVLSRWQRRWRLAPVSAAVAAVALAACGTSHPASSPSASSTTTGARPTAGRGAAVPACAHSQLRLAYAGTEGATGHLELALLLRNVSTRGCALRGYASARLLDATGRALPLRVARGGGFFPDTRGRPRRVVLAPGSQARYGLSFVINNEYAGARHCVTAATLMSRAPGQSNWTRMALTAAGRPRISPCGSRLVLSPVYMS